MSAITLIRTLSSPFLHREVVQERSRYDKLAAKSTNEATDWRDLSAGLGHTVL